MRSYDNAGHDAYRFKQTWRTGETAGETQQGARKAQFFK